MKAATAPRGTLSTSRGPAYDASRARHTVHERQRMILKGFLLVDGVVVLVAATFDAAAQRVLLVAAVVAAVGVLWKQVVKPLGSMLKHAAQIVKKTASALDALEHLPERWRQQEERDREKDERIAAVEAEVGIVHVEVSDVQNQVVAIRRDLGISDDKVRSL